MSELGFIAVSLALGLTTYSVVALALGTRRGSARLAVSGRRAVYASAALLTLAVLMLVYALVTRDFRIEYVTSHTSRDLPLAYTLSALWAGQEGSLLFWAWILSLYATAVLFSTRRRDDRLRSFASLVMAAVQVFFLLLLILVNNPFQTLDFVPGDGLGMNPLLQNPAMIWHPPIVYLGYVGFTVPFAFTIALLVSGRLKEAYVPLVRRWTLLPWLCLGVGTLLGAQWAYVELGWGGYWAWDPVENASLLPWLTATALVHALMFRGNRVKVSHIALVVTTFALCIFGTFVTRSGMISSVHAFAVSTIGFYFLGFLALVIGGSVAVAYRRRSFLRGGDETEELISRPSALLLTIILLAAGTAAILVGTLFPLISEAVNLSLTADYFNLSSVVIFGPLILLMGICPFVPWREGSLKGVARAVLVPFIVAIVVAAGLFVLGLRDVFGFLAFSVCAFVLVGTLTQFVPGVGGRGDAPAGNRLRWAWSRLARQSRRYGSFLVHLGILLIAVGVIGSTAYRIEQEVTLERGESATVGPYSLTYDDFSYVPAQARDIAAATITVEQGGRAVGVLRPERQFFYATQQPVSEVAIHSTLREDLYLALIGWGEEGQNVVLEVVVSPLVVWIWIGGAVLLVGGAVALRPSRKKDVVDQRIELAVRNLRGRGVRPVQEA